MVKKASVKGTVAAKSGKKVATKKASAKKASAKKVATKKASAKKASAKKVATKKVPAAEGQYGMKRDHDVRWNAKKVAVFIALKKLGAVGEEQARSAQDVATKAGVTTMEVRHYCYHAMVSGFTGVAQLEGIRGYAFYLTKKGAAVSPAEELEKQNK